MQIICQNALKARDRNDAIIQLNQRLLAKGYVKETHLAEVLKREESFPTGLRLEGGVNVALPHCDAEHTNEMALAIGILDQEVGFRQMGSAPESSDIVPVKVVFLLACNDKKLLLPYLQKFTRMFRQKDLIKRISESQGCTEVEEAVSGFLEKGNVVDSA